MKHLYVAFWRPDILAQLQVKHTRQAALCDLIVDTNDMTADLRECDCPACRETFLEALPTGSGKKYSFEEYLADMAKDAKRRADEQAAKIANDNRNRGGWSTGNPDITEGWSSDPWRTK